MPNVAWNSLVEINRDVPEKYFVCIAAYVVAKPVCTFLLSAAMKPEDQRSQGFRMFLYPAPAEVSLDSLNVLMIFWINDGEIPKFLATVVDYLPTHP